jgi:hypothetical protein
VDSGREKAYDRLDAVLAEREVCELWTAAERVYNLTALSFRFVHWLGLFAPF